VPIFTTGGAAGAGATGVPPKFGTSGNGAGDNPGIFKIPDSGATIRSHDSSCGAVSEVPEQIIKYTEASVTDTTYTSTPVAVFIMLDRSISMTMAPIGAPAGAPISWDSAKSSITAFVNDPMSAGLDIGMGTFPVGPQATFDCATGADCGTPVVPIMSLPGNAGAMANAMTSQTPMGLAFTPTECALRGMINTCLQYHAMSPTGEPCVAVLVTDGTPTQCDLDENNLTAIIADGKAKGVQTYTLGLPGSDINVLNQYAVAGGTGMAVDVSAGPTAFIAALNAIRGKIAHQEKHTVVTKHTVQTPLKCQWKIPAQPMGSPALDPTKVNLQFTGPGAPPVQWGHVASMAMCPTNTSAWYFDDEMHPTQIFLCPNTCLGVENTMNSRIDILLHCPRIEAPPA
jgi:hypothetical protein